ncbi:hypothetical protein OWV82_012692 [Melia azedarach]|uniref:Uncharacterized protein n=1 Tax=Melia azedarach TaxID=155640 RepID=A0ACC1XV43_MELAZ|nr:hypothetical protein OWV82_012692 [Melia azedarach]
MFSLSQKKRKTNPVTGKVTFEADENSAAATGSAARSNTSDQYHVHVSHPPSQARHPVGSGGMNGALNSTQQRSSLGFGSYSNLASLFHGATQQRAPVGFAAFHGVSEQRSQLGVGSFDHRANFLHAGPQQTPLLSFSGTHGGGNHFRGTTPLTPPPPVGFPGSRGGGNDFRAQQAAIPPPGFPGGSNYFHGSISRQQTPRPQLGGLAGTVGNLFTPQRIPVALDGGEGAANLVHENPHQPRPEGFTTVDGVGYVFHRITEQRRPVRITGVDGGGSCSNPSPPAYRHGRFILTPSDESHWDDGLTQLFRAIEVSRPRDGYERGESSDAAANRNEGRYFFLGERCLVCHKKFRPGDDIYLFM